jgi:predicted nucleic acid-binding protein
MALAHGLTLTTRNTADFEHINGLTAVSALDIVG